MGLCGLVLIPQWKVDMYTKVCIVSFEKSLECKNVSSLD